MKFPLLVIIFLFLACSPESSTPHNIDFYPTYTKDLEDSIQALDLTYVGWFCQCANWATEAEIDRYRDTGKLSEHSIFVEPADSTLKLPDTIGYSGDVIRFTGQFYKDKGYPKNYPITEMKVDTAKVFRYTKFEILRSGYKNFKNTIGSGN